MPLRGSSLTGIRNGAPTDHPVIPPHTGFGSSLYSWGDTYFGGPWVKGHMPASIGRPVSVSTSSQLQGALNSARAGDTISLATATYTNISCSNLLLSNSNPVTIQPAGGASPVIRTSGTAHHAWFMTNCSGFRFNNLLWDSAAQCSTKFDTKVTDIEFNNCEFTGFGAVDAGHGILTDFECERFAIWNCKAHGGGDHGMYLGSQGSPAGTAKFGISGLLVANYLAYDNSKGPGSASGSSAGMGIQLGDSVRHARVVNFTCDNNGINSGSGGGATLYTQASVTGEKGTDVFFYNGSMTNNISWGFIGPGTDPNKGTNGLQYCLGFNNGSGNFFGGNILNVLSPNVTGSDPKYTNRAAKNFHLQGTSPAISAGIDAWAPETDLDGVTRTTADIGCYAH